MDTLFVTSHTWLVPLVITVMMFVRAAWTVTIRHFPREENVDAEDFVVYVNAAVVSGTAWAIWAIVDSLVR